MKNLKFKKEIGIDYIIDVLPSKNQTLCEILYTCKSVKTLLIL